MSQQFPQAESSGIVSVSKSKSSRAWMRRTLQVGTHDLSCSHPQTGALQAESALAYSCNDFFATYGLRLSSAELQAAFQKSGFVSPSGLLPDEATGFIRPTRTDEERQ
ncbi:MAG: hypothetical protein WA741_19940 [Candidatus Sulfotelmatobacter sp.]